MPTFFSNKASQEDQTAHTRTFRSFIIRHRITIRDLAIVLTIFLVATYVAYDVDIFLDQRSGPTKEKSIELDEAPLLGGVLTLGMLVFSIRRYREQKRETARRIAAEQDVRKLAFQDTLTGLANRRQFDDALQAAVDAPPRAGASHALFMLDLNGFKRVNDVYGHGAGDEVLVVVAQRLSSVGRDTDLVARYGGDEFSILAQHLVGPEAAASIAYRIIQTLEQPILVRGVEHRIGAGIGIALLPADATTAQEALRKADVALYRAKAERRSAMRFFEEDMDRLIRERDAMEHELRAAIESDAINVLFQPAFDLKTNQVVGFEAVPHWLHAELGEVPPARFIPIAEELGLIHVLADRLLRQACSAAVQWPPEIRLAVDVFPGQLLNRDLGKRISVILDESGLAPSRLEVEISESDLVRDVEGAQAIFGTLRERGVHVVLDNFGTGYSSLYHLRTFKLDKIKIDRSFVESIGAVGENPGIIRALVGLGQGLGLTVSAGGVEDSEQRKALLGSGCEQGQGDLLSETMTAAATMQLIRMSGLGDQAA